MKILIIDNYDSFTYNLAHYVSTYNQNLTVVRYDKIKIDMINDYDKIIFSPGPGIPSEYPKLFKIIEKFKDKNPILGVCLGHQIIAEFFNAKIKNLKSVKHGVKSKVTHYNNCYLFKSIPKVFNVGHYHSWFVYEKKLPECLEVTSINNENIITSIKHLNFNIRGVQFHPESILTEYGLKLIKNWTNHNQA